MGSPITQGQLAYLAGTADGLAGTVQPKTVEEVRRIGRMMRELVNEVARLSGHELPKVPSGA